MSELDLEDIQGNILRGYRKFNARHHALCADPGARPAALLGRLLDGAADGIPQVTSAARWPQRPPYCLNVGVTAAGLERLGLPQSILRLFPRAYLRGPAADAVGLGDRGPSAPENWELGGTHNEAVHLLVSLYTDEAREPCLEALDARLLEGIAAHGLRLVWTQTVYTQPGDRVHFGYRDGIAQPRIRGASAGMREDLQPECEPGDFLLGRDHVNAFGGNFLGDIPGELGDNASYAALRILDQDAAGFEALIERAGLRYNLDPELVAAKLMGRWRNGTPLSLAPTLVEGPPDARGRPMPMPPQGPDEAQLNAFDYAPSAGHPHWYDDALGVRCPIGSHVRRHNPRGALVMGKPYSRRLIRRGMSYGPVYDPADPASAGQRRGLAGLFICGDLELQFEFLQQVWANMDIATSGMRGTRDPIMGFQPAHGGQFIMRTEDRNDPVILTDLPQLVTTRGSVYLLLPGLGGLRMLASLA